jgi:TRAP-type C4-dicarboxylate transport system permease large subunit
LQLETTVFFVMLGTFLLCNLLLRLPVSLSMVAGAVAGALAAGEGIPLRHLFEGTFVYFDTVLIISTAMIFMTVIQKSGALDSLGALIVTRFYKVPAVMLVLLMLMVMFPGMVTGSSTASVLSAGAIVAPILLLMGIPAPQAGAFLAIGAVLGMAAPPVNIPAMLIAGGVDMPYIGFGGTLLLLTLSCGVFTALFIGLRHCGRPDFESVREKLDLTLARQYGFKLYIPIITIMVLMVVGRVFANVLPNLGMPLIFVIGSVIGLFTGRKFDAVETVLSAVRTTVPVLGKLMGVGMFIQIMTLTGVRGLIVNRCIGLNAVLIYMAICTVMPAFGAVSSYGAASVLGVPFMLALLSPGDQTVIAAARAFIASLGDLMPPTALAGNYAAQIVGERYGKVLPHCLIPFLACVLCGLIVLLQSGRLSFLV